MIFLILGKKFNKSEIWALKKDFKLIKLYEYGFDNEFEQVEDQNFEDNIFPRRRVEKMRFELDFMHGSPRVKVDRYKLNVTYAIKRAISVGEIGMMMQDIGFDRKNQVVFKEIQIDLRNYDGLILKTKNDDFKEEYDGEENWQNYLNILKW